MRKGETKRQEILAAAERLFLSRGYDATSVQDVLDDIVRECERLMCAPLLCETNGDKGFLATELRRRGIAVRSYAEQMNKHQKIAAYLRKWWTHIRFLEGTDRAYIRQILDYTEHAAHDDAPDSAASLIRALDRRTTISS